MGMVFSLSANAPVRAAHRAANHASLRCLNALRAASRRPARAWDVPGVDRPEPTRLGEVTWRR
jgi:hypothetical protein